MHRGTWAEIQKTNVHKIKVDKKKRAFLLRHKQYFQANATSRNYDQKKARWQRLEKPKVLSFFTDQALL